MKPLVRGALALSGFAGIGLLNSPLLSTTFVISYPETTLSSPFSGSIVLYFSRSATPEPRRGPNWFRPEPMFSATFNQISPGQKVTFPPDKSIGFPVPLTQLPAGRYYVQAVMDRNLGGRAIGTSPGNLYSEPVAVDFSPETDEVVELVCDRIVSPPVFRETDYVKEIRVESRLLSAFYKRPTTINAAVLLPDEWQREPNRKFPVIYDVPGFGGTHLSLSGRASNRECYRDGIPFLYVVLDPSCPLGHSVFADSANNGPWGRALTEELIPELEKRFRALAKPEARFVMGHSSGGWSALWLQVTYPDFFGGCWSLSPDPVDFRDFQQINIYEPGANMFYDKEGRLRPLARIGDFVAITYKQFSDMERPLRGEQLGSFEAVFSPRGEDGRPKQLWDRDTGAIHPDVAEAWKKYDIGLILRTRAEELRPKLARKIYVYMGDKDTFYLEGAVKLLKDDLKKERYEAFVEIIPGDHSAPLRQNIQEQISKQIADQFRRLNPSTFPEKRLRALCSLFPSCQVLSLLFTELINFHAHRLEFQRSHLGINALGDGVNPFRQLLAFLVQILYA